jgi:hypothetical protein
MSPPTPTGSNRWPAIVLLVATSVGVPGSLVALFKDKALQHPWITLLCVATWELVVLISSLITDVWSKLRSRWVDRLADWVDHSLQALFSRYRRRYLDWIFYRHRDFDVKGLTTQSVYNLELEQVFVDLTIQPPPPGGNPADPLRPFPKDLTGRRSIWDYLASESFKDHLALIGPPGSGKTTLLKKIALQMTGRHRPKIRQKLPILLFLREHTEAILATPTPSLADVASADLARKQSFVRPPAEWFKGKLDAGRCLVLLDGLDEVASLEIRQKVVAWVEIQTTAFPKSRFLISSRPHGYRSSPVSGVTVLEIQPFNRRQMRQFVHNWYRANEIHASGKLDPGVEMKAREGAEDLLRRLGNSQTLTDLAVNPLLLTMTATVHRFRSSLPGRRVELYSEICEVFLGKRQKARGVEDVLSPIQKQRVLQPLAYHLMAMKDREIRVEDAAKIISGVLQRVTSEKPSSPETDFLKDTENGSGLLLERESGTYSFAHLAFQEYLAAVHIWENNLSDELAAKVVDPWWHEVIRLYGAQGDASGILAACLSSGTPSVQELSLAIDCLEEAREVDPEWRAKIDSFLKEGAASSDPDRFHLAAGTILARRLRTMVAIGEETFADRNYLSNAEYQLFLDESGALGNFHQPDHWQNFNFPKGDASVPAVGMRRSDVVAFCEWLNGRDGAFVFRLPKLGEIDRNRLGAMQNLTGTVAGFWTEDGFERVVLSPGFPPAYLKTLSERDLSETNLHRRLDFNLNPIVGALIHNHSLSLDLNLDLDCHLDLYPDRDLAYVLNRSRRLGLGGVPVSDLTPALSLFRVLEYALDRDRFRSTEAYEKDRWLGRLFSLYLATRSNPRQKTRFRSLFWRGGLDMGMTKSRQELWLPLYRSLVLLEARIEGIVPAFEGIWLIKERRS